MRTSQELEAAVIGKATEDADFRSLLLSDPKGRIEQELDIRIPEAMEIQVHQESSTSAHLVLPPAGKLKTADLQAVADGSIGQPEPEDW